MTDFSWLDSDFTVRFCLTLLHSIWQFILLALLATVAGRLIKRRGVQWRYSVNVIALVIGLVMLPLTFALLSDHHAADNIATMAPNQVETAPLQGQIEQTPFNELQIQSPSTEVDRSPLMPQAEIVSPPTTIIGNLGGCVVRDGSRADAVAINVSNRSRQSTRRAGARFD